LFGYTSAGKSDVGTSKDACGKPPRTLATDHENLLHLYTGHQGLPIKDPMVHQMPLEWLRPGKALIQEDQVHLPHS
jgi:hypothetical protein